MEKRLIYRKPFPHFDLKKNKIIFVIIFIIVYIVIIIIIVIIIFVTIIIFGNIMVLFLRRFYCYLCLSSLSLFAV